MYVINQIWNQGSITAVTFNTGAQVTNTALQQWLISNGRCSPEEAPDMAQDLLKTQADILAMVASYPAEKRSKVPRDYGVLLGMLMERKMSHG